MISLEQYEVIGEFASHASGCDEGIPKLVQWWIPTEKVDDPNPANKRETPNRWCACLGDKYVELRPDDRVVVLRPKSEKGTECES